MPTQAEINAPRIYVDQPYDGSPPIDGDYRIVSVRMALEGVVVEERRDGRWARQTNHRDLIVWFDPCASSFQYLLRGVVIAASVWAPPKQRDLRGSHHVTDAS